jgi:type II secretory pathway pseudopilin PulG
VKRPARASDAGETLIELIVAITIMGLVVIAVVAGIFALTLNARIRAEQATGHTLLTAFGQAMTAPSAAFESSCAHTPETDYTGEAAVVETGMKLPTGYHLTVVSVTYWDGTDYATSDATSPNCSQVQRLDLEVTLPKVKSGSDTLPPELLSVAKRNAASLTVVGASG